MAPCMDVSEWKEGWQLWDLIRFLGDCGALSSGLMLRGQANADWKLVPALYRRPVHIFGDNSEEERYVTAERWMLDTFFDRALLLLPNFERGEIIDRIIAQHYGVPTQLLDWTLDPFIGLYFAVSDDREEDAAGALYYIGGMSRIPARSRIGFPFTDRLTRVNPPVLDERVKSQKSIFTLQSFGGTEAFVPLDDRELKFSKPGEGSHPDDQVFSFGKVIIPRDQKRQILAQLMEMGVDASLMFPGLQGIGDRIAAHARLKNYGGDGMF